METEKLKEDLQKIFDEMIEQQKTKAKKIAMQHNPHLTTEDLLNPDNFPAVINNPHFMYEDGMAAGMLSCQMAIRAYLNSLQK